MNALPQELKELISAQHKNWRVQMFGNTLLNPDKLLRLKSTEGVSFYDDLENDAHAFAVLQKRKLAVAGCEWTVEPSSKNRKDRYAADMVRAQFTELGMDGLTEHLLDAILKGLSGTEILWDVSGTEVVASRAELVDPAVFVFDKEKRPHLLTEENPIHGVLLPERKFILHRSGGKNGTPYGGGLGRKLFWPVYFKRHDLDFWLVFLEKYGFPTTVGKYPAGATPEQQSELHESVRKIGKNSTITIQEDTLIEFLESSRSQGANFDALLHYLDEQISEAVLGETLTTSAGSNGSRALGTVHNNVRKDILKADCDLLSESINKSLCRWLTFFNAPEGAVPPKFWRDVSEPADLTAKADQYTKLYSIGFKPTLERIESEFGKGFVEMVAPPANGLPATEVQELAEGEDLSVEQLLTRQVSKELQPQVDAWFESAILLLNKCESLEEFRDRLLELYPNLSPGDFGKIMEEALIATELIGREEAKNDAD